MSPGVLPDLPGEGAGEDEHFYNKYINSSGLLYKLDVEDPTWRKLYELATNTFSAIVSPIDRHAVAAGDGALQT